MRSYGIIDSGDAKTGELGVMTDARWSTFFAMASDKGVFPKSLDYKSAYALGFTGPAGK
jgi:NitT/TauT family transport system substrate-binding protein